MPRSGCDPTALVVGAAEVKARGAQSAARYGGRWVCRRFIDGREFNVAVIERAGWRRGTAPMAEMTFESWPALATAHRRLHRQMGRCLVRIGENCAPLRRPKTANEAGARAALCARKAGACSLAAYRAGRFPRHAGWPAL